MGLFVCSIRVDYIYYDYATHTFDTPLLPPFIVCIGDHLEEVAEMIVTKFGVSGDAVFLDLDGEFVSYA